MTFTQISWSLLTYAPNQQTQQSSPGSALAAATPGAPALTLASDARSVGQEATSMRRIMAATLIVVLLSGCAKVHTVDLSSEGAVADLNATVSGKTVLLRMAAGHAIEAEQVEVAPESTKFVYGIGTRRSREEVPTRSIRSVVASQKWGVEGGAVRGMLFGAIVGGVLALRSDLAAYSSTSTSGIVGIGIALGGLVGLVGGAVLGRGVSNEHVYELVEGQ